MNVTINGKLLEEYLQDKALANITVNGQPLQQHLSLEKSREVAKFISEETRFYTRISRKHITSNGTKSHEYRREAPKAQVTYA